MNDIILKSLNNQIKIEYEASNYYLCLAIHFEAKGFRGISEFFYDQSNGERDHMLILIKYVNEKGGKAILPKIDKVEISDDMTVLRAFNDSLDKEINVTNSINESHHIATNQKDYTTANFLHWFINEQREEEDKVRAIIDKLKIIGDSGIGLYQIDKELAEESSIENIQ